MPPRDTSSADPQPVPSGAGGRLAAAGQRRPLVLVWVGTFLYSTGPVMVGAADVSGPILSFWRLWIGVVVMGAATALYVAVSGRRPDGVGWSWAARAGCAFGVHQLMFMSAVRATSVVDVVLMQVLAPVVVAALAVPLFGERPGPAFRLWSGLAIVGAAIVVLAGTAGPQGAPLGMALAVGNVGFFAVYFVWSKQARAHIDVIPFLFGVMVAAAVTVSGWVVVAGESPGTARWSDLALAAAIAVVPGALGHFASTWPLRWVAANIPPVVQLVMPFLSGGLAWLVLGQEASLLHLLGGALTIVGVAGAMSSRSDRRWPSWGRR